MVVGLLAYRSLIDSSSRLKNKQAKEATINVGVLTSLKYKAFRGQKVKTSGRQRPKDLTSGIKEAERLNLGKRYD